jgi:hypothetical protein
VPTDTEIEPATSSVLSPVDITIEPVEADPPADEIPDPPDDDDDVDDDNDESDPVRIVIGPEP